MQEFAEIAENDLLKSGFSEETRLSADSLGGFKPAQVMIDQIRILYLISDFGCDEQKYISMAKSQSGFSRRYFFCPYKKCCSYQVSFSIKEYKDRYELLQSGVHDRQSHVVSSGILSPKQCSAIDRSIKASPLSGPTEVMLNLKNLSPGKRVAHDVRSTAAVGRLVRKARSEVMASRIQRAA